MSLTTSEMSAADLAAVVGNDRNNDVWGDGNAFWIIILFLFAMMGGGFGGFGGYGGFGNGFGGAMVADNMMMWPWMMTQNTDNLVQGGFNQQTTASAVNGLQNAVTSGFGDTQLGIAGINQNICQTGGQITNAMNQGFSGVQQSICNGFNSVNQGVSGGFAQAEIAANNRQMANMQQSYANQIADMQQMNGLQAALTSQLNGMQMVQQNCCCENRAQTADLKYTLATEACADRAAISDGIRDVITNGTANTQAMLNSISGGIQSIKDQLCQDKIDAKNETIQALRDQLTFANLQASQTAQTAQLLADNARQTSALEQYLNPAPIPAYVVQNPSCCNQNFAGCGGSF